MKSNGVERRVDIMNSSRRILLLVVILALGISGAGTQPAHARSPSTVSPGYYVGRFHISIYSITYANVNQPPITESTNDVYNLYIEGRVQVTIEADNNVAAIFAIRPGNTTFYEYHMFTLDTPTVHCNTLGYLDGQAKVTSSDVQGNPYNAENAFFMAHFSVARPVPQASVQRGGNEVCAYPVSQQVLKSWVINITNSLADTDILRFDVYNSSSSYMGGAVFVAGWAERVPNEYGFTEQTSSGTWWARRITAQPKDWRQR